MQLCADTPGARECRFEFYISGIPFSRLGGIWGEETGGAPLNEYIGDGENELMLVIEPGETPSVAMTGRSARIAANDPHRPGTPAIRPAPSLAAATAPN